jgi:hypothetical protein
VLTAEELCDICDASPAQRQAWAKDGDLRQRRGFEELDAAELAACAAIRDAVGPKRGKAAWRELRPVLQGLLIQASSGIWVVVECRGVERHDLVTTPKDLARRVAHGRPVVVVDLRSPVDLARKAYRDAVGVKRGDLDAVVRDIRSRH